MRALRLACAHVLLKTLFDGLQLHSSHTSHTCLDVGDHLIEPVHNMAAAQLVQTLQTQGEDAIRNMARVLADVWTPTLTGLTTEYAGGTGGIAMLKVAQRLTLLSNFQQHQGQKINDLLFF